MGNRRIAIAFAFVISAAGCGGSSSPGPDTLVDAAPDGRADDAGVVGEPDASGAPDADGVADGGVPGHATIERMALVEPGVTCEFGGTTTTSGRDDGEPGGVADDAILDAAEVESTVASCRTSPDPALIATSGLDARPVNTTCRVPSGPANTEGVRMVPAFPGVVFPPNAGCFAPFNDSDCSNAFRPLGLVQHPSTREFYVVEQSGRVVFFPENAAAGTLAAVALDIAGKTVFGFEPGLLNASIDPAHPEHFFLTYVTCVSQENSLAPAGTACVDGEGTEVWVAVSRFTRLADGTLDAASERLVLEVGKPRTEHNGGGATFGPDGMLYVGLGDGGAFPSDAAQDTQSRLGKFLRVDIHDAAGDALEGGAPRFRIPSTNPFVGTASYLPEIFALGFRNPWRYSFEPSLDALGRAVIWAGDVGLVTSEELDRVRAGQNLGWPILEGNFCRPRGDAVNQVTVLASTDCDPSGLTTRPVMSYVQAEGVSITGGPVYRGTAIPSLVGSVLVSDFSRGQIRALGVDQTGDHIRWVTETGLLLGAFAEDLAHEVYVLDWWSGTIGKLVPVNASRSRPASTLSATGCVSRTHPLEPAVGAFPYSPVAPLFSEAEVAKSRFMYVPEGSVLTEYATTGSLILQPGTVLVKNFDIGAKRIETRLAFRHTDGDWSFWSYRWRDDQSDADLVEEGAVVAFGSVEWVFPSRAQCFHCHTVPTGRVLGVTIQQLNGLGYFPSTKRWANQVDTLRSLGMVNRVVATNPALPIGDGNATIVPLPRASSLPAHARIDDETQTLARRVGSYLETNCSNCHRPAGGGRGDFDLRSAGFLSVSSGVCRTPTMSGAYDLGESYVVVPGDPDASVLARRLGESTLPYRMHPYRRSVDTAGLALVRRWIVEDSEYDCPP